MNGSNYQSPEIRGSYKRTPEQMAAHWGYRQMAPLDDRSTIPLLFRIDAKNPDDYLELGVTRQYGRVYEDESFTRFYRRWRVHERGSNNPSLNRIANKIIFLAGMPTPEQVAKGREERLHNDMIFLGGELRVSLPNFKTTAAPRRTIWRGTVLGLSIVTPENEIFVW